MSNVGTCGIEHRAIVRFSYNLITMRTVSVRHDLLTPRVIPSFAFSIRFLRTNLDFVAKREDSIQCIAVSQNWHYVLFNANLFVPVED